MLEEKTIIIAGEYHQHPQREIILRASSLDVADKSENSDETLENSDTNSTLLLWSLAKRYLCKKSLLNPGNFFVLCNNPLDFYVSELIKETESFLYPILLKVPPEVYKISATEIYQGSFDEYLRKSGFGIQVINGEKYTGYFTKGHREGYGRVLNHGNNVYEGDFKNGKLEGEGICIERGIKYKGMFKNGLKSGDGREEWPDKSFYCGQFEKNLKHGNGKFSWSNGNEFEGDFEDGNISGEGTFKWKNGKEYKGHWKNNKMHGYGEFKWPNGKAYKGYYKKDVKHGVGTLVWPDGREYEGQWKKGLQHGIGYYKWFNKLKDKQEQRKGEWEEGNRIKWLS